MVGIRSRRAVCILTPPRRQSQPAALLPAKTARLATAAFDIRTARSGRLPWRPTAAPTRGGASRRRASRRAGAAPAFSRQASSRAMARRNHECDSPAALDTMLEYQAGRQQRVGRASRSQLAFARSAEDRIAWSGSELGVEFFDLLGLGVCLLDPVDHRGVREHGVAVARAIGVQGYVVGLETGADGRVYRVGGGRSRAE